MACQERFRWKFEGSSASLVSPVSASDLRAELELQRSDGSTMVTTARGERRPRSPASLEDDDAADFGIPARSLVHTGLVVARAEQNDTDERHTTPQSRPCVADVVVCLFPSQTRPF